jgi:hypothetical protein
MSEPSRRFPPPWHADKIPGGYVIRDANGQALAFVYSRENDAEARQAKVLTPDEARRIAVNIARLPELLGKGESDLGASATRDEPRNIRNAVAVNNRRRVLPLTGPSELGSGSWGGKTPTLPGPLSRNQPDQALVVMTGAAQPYRRPRTAPAPAAAPTRGRSLSRLSPIAPAPSCRRRLCEGAQ